MDKIIKEKMLATYERRLDSTKRRQEAEKNRLNVRHEKEIQALENQYKNMLKLNTSEVN